MTWIATAVTGIGAIATIGGAAQQANASRASAKAEREAANFEANRAERSADEVEKKTREDLRRFGIQVQKAEGGNIAALGASGITLEGSAMEALAENARNAELDKINIETQGSARARELREAAQFQREQGVRIERAGGTSASAQLLSGVGEALSFFR